MESINIQKYLGVSRLFDLTELTLLISPHLQNNQDFTLTSYGEGFSFTTNGLYAYLDQLCSHFKFQKNKITIETWNLLEQHNEYNIKIQNHIFDCNYFTDPSILNLEDTKIGIFLSKANYIRLLFHSKLQYVSYRDRLLYTFHQDFNNVPWPEGIEKFVMSGNDYSSIAKTTPVNDLMHRVKFPLIPPENIFDLADTYKRVAFEIVFESLWENGFFVTEKTLRPMYYGRPILIVGPPNFEKNLEKLGFNLNFNFPFDIYKLHGENKINLVFDILSNWFLKINVLDWFESIRPILEHNQKVLKTYASRKGHIDLDIIKQLF